MPYASQAKIQDAAGGAANLVQISDWDGDGQVDAAAIAHGQAAADGLFDGYFAQRYSVPLENPTDTVITMAAQEAVYQIKLANRAMSISEDDRRGHEERIAWLRDVAKGLIRPSNPAPAVADTVRSTIAVNTRDQSRENLKGFT